MYLYILKLRVIKLLKKKNEITFNNKNPNTINMIPFLVANFLVQFGHLRVIELVLSEFWMSCSRFKLGLLSSARVNSSCYSWLFCRSTSISNAWINLSCGGHPAFISGLILISWSSSSVLKNLLMSSSC